MQIAYLLPYSRGLWVSMGRGLQQLKVWTKQLLGAGHIGMWLGPSTGSTCNGAEGKEALLQALHYKGGHWEGEMEGEVKICTEICFFFS